MEHVFKNNEVIEKFMGVNWTITIKRDTVPAAIIYKFADPKFIGKFYILENTLMSNNKGVI